MGPVLGPKNLPELVLFTCEGYQHNIYGEINLPRDAFPQHRGIISAVTNSAVISRAKGVEEIGIRIHSLVRASLSKIIAHPSHANPEMFQKAELARAKAFKRLRSLKSARAQAIKHEKWKP